MHDSTLTQTIANHSLLLLQIHLDDLQRGFVNHIPGDMFENVCFIVDSTECPIKPPRGEPILEGALFSGKHGKHTLKYEIAIQAASSRIVWVNGAIPGSFHDSRVITEGGLLNELQGEEKGVGDKAYIGIDPFRLLTPIKSPQFLHHIVWNIAIDSVRSEIERINRRVKKFRCFQDRWRNRRIQAHKETFFIACHLLNIWNDMKPSRRALHPLLLSCPLARPELPE